MSKSKKYPRIGKEKFHYFFITVFVLIIAFSIINNFSLSFDFETEKIENYCDHENENKEQEKFDKIEKEVFLTYPKNLKYLTRTYVLCTNIDLSKIHNLYLKIPTPPPDLI